MLRLNIRQLLAAVTLLIFVLMLGERLYVISRSEVCMAWQVAGHPKDPLLEFQLNNKTFNFRPNDFTSIEMGYKEYVAVYVPPKGKPFVKSFSGIFGERIFYFCNIVFAWLLLGSAILAKNEELLIGKGWLKAKKTKTGTTPETSRLPAVRKKSRNFKNE